MGRELALEAEFRRSVHYVYLMRIQRRAGLGVCKGGVVEHAFAVTSHLKTVTTM